MSQSVSQSAIGFTFFPLAWLTASFSAGIVLSRNADLAWQVCLGSCLISALLTVIFFSQKYSVIFLLFAFIALGSFSERVERFSLAPDRLKSLFDSGKLASAEPLEISGVLQGKPELAVGGFFLTLQTQKIILRGVEQEVSGRIRLFLPVRDEQIEREYEDLQLEYGTEIRAACELYREERFQNSGGVSTKYLLDQQGIDASAVIKSPLLIENLGQKETFFPFAWVYQRRQNLIFEFKKHFSVSTAGVLIASLLGNKYHLDKSTAESFREGGTFHILVISGLQITFIGGLVILLLRQWTRSRFRQFLLASIFLWIYTLAVGADAPVTRAALMFTVWYFAHTVFRQANLLNTLAASALILLIYHPSEIFSQSFQLTFVCVLSIVAMGVPLLEKLQKIGSWHPQRETPAPPNVPPWLKSCCEILYWSETEWQKEMRRNIWQCRLLKSPYAAKLESWKLQKVLRYAFETIIVSLIVQAWLLPFAVIYFHRISWASIFLNVPVGALMALESLLAIAGIVIAQISEILAAPFIWLTELLNWLILNITIFFIGFEWSALRLPHYTNELSVVYLLYFLPITALTIFLLRWDPFAFIKPQQSLRKIRKLCVSGYFLLFFFIVLHPFSAPRADGRLKIDFLDVGQGDSALVTMPTGETLLVDGGGKTVFRQLYVQREGEEPEPFEPDVQNIGETVVSNFLWAKGYNKIDYLLATHADTDHLQGLTDIARNFRINAALIAAEPLQDTDFAEFYKMLERKEIAVIKVSQGNVLTFGEVKVEVLHPSYDERDNQDWDNNQSIVLRLNYGETSFLLTGDVEKQAENKLLQTPDSLKADVVKVAHHGSRTSSSQEFIGATGAEFAVISAGLNSPFGHPHQEVVERWKKSGTKVLTTGENGTVTIISDGKELEVKTFRGSLSFR